jgi:prepilin-type N-terminal cleavage/methylation domain-containing protein
MPCYLVRERAGFTLVEVLVALVLLSVGLVALLGTSGFVTRLIGDGARLSRVAGVVSERFELLRSQGCAPAGGDSARTDEFRVSWNVTGEESDPIRRITVVVTWPTPRGERSSSFVGTCRP